MGRAMAMKMEEDMRMIPSSVQKWVVFPRILCKMFGHKLLRRNSYRVIPGLGEWNGAYCWRCGDLLHQMRVYTAAQLSLPPEAGK